LPEGLTFETVCDEQSLKNFFLPFTAVHKMPDFAVQALFKGFRRMGFGSGQPYRHFIGWMDGRPVASISLFVSAGVTGSYNGVTIPECRRKGVGAALFSHVFKEAHAMGYRFNVGMTSEMMRSIASRKGFKEYFTVAYYEWKPKKKKKHGLIRLANYILRALR
jgi:GNAT superfamily N-acetyltransferase